MAAATPGRATAARTRSRPGPTTRSPTGPGEAIYLRDEETGELWTADARAHSPRRRALFLRARHGLQPLRAASRTASRSSSRCSCRSTDPIKICRLRVRNESPRRRSVSVTAYVEWVLGPSRTRGAPHVLTELDEQRRAVCAQSLEPALSRRGVRGSARRADRIHLRPPRVPRASWHARRARGAGVRRAVLGPRRRRTRSLRRAAHAHRARARRRAPNSCSCSARRRMTTQRARLLDALSRRRHRRAARRGARALGRSSRVTCR